MDTSLPDLVACVEDGLHTPVWTLTYADKTVLSVSSYPARGDVPGGLLVSRLDPRMGVPILVGRAEQRSEQVRVCAVSDELLATLGPDAPVEEICGALWSGLLQAFATAQATAPGDR